MAVGAAFLLLFILAGLTDINTITPILVSMIGIGVGIDYSLFIVTRFRQLLHEGLEPRDAAGAFPSGDPTTVGQSSFGQSGFQEGDAAQYTWMVPQNFRALFQGMGGDSAVRARLDAYFTQLNVRTYVMWNDEPAVLFLAARVTPGGYGGVVLGAPYKLARIRVCPGEAKAPGMGLSIRYHPAGPGDPGELGRHRLGLFESGGIRTFRIERGEADWQRAEAVAPATAHLLLGYGFAPKGEPDLVYAARASFEAQPPA